MDTRRKSQRVRRRNPGEPQFEGLECRDLLHAGSAGYHCGFAALNLSLQATRHRPEWLAAVPRIWAVHRCQQSRRTGGRCVPVDHVEARNELGANETRRPPGVDGSHPGMKFRSEWRDRKPLQFRWREVEALESAGGITSPQPKISRTIRNVTLSSGRSCDGLPSEHHNSPSDTARNAASARVPTASLRKIRLT
jgi:hypothetical protein